MSEYQYYEFQVLDRRLTQAEMAEVGALSSRARVTPTSAAFLYHYGDFRGDPKRVLGNYFDAMLYIANWGTRRLIFRFPKALANADAMRPYCLPDTITVEIAGEHLILDIEINKEDSEWISTGEGLLTPLTPLRAAILDGDYRALYLAWLRACELALGSGDVGEDPDEDEEAGEDEEDYYSDDDITPATPEPPVPANLKKLDGALEAFAEFVELDPTWIAVGAEASVSAAKSQEPVEQWIAALPEEDCHRLLLRAARGEPDIALHIRSELRSRFAGSPPAEPAGAPRQAGQLLALVKERKRQAAREQRRREEEERVRRLEALAQREAEAWEEVVASIQQRSPKGYDQAVSLLVELRELAQHRGEQVAYQGRLDDVVRRFRTLSSFKARLIGAGLIER